MPIRTDPDTGKEIRTIFVRVTQHMMTYRKDDLVYPEPADFNNDDDLWKLHKDDAPRRRVANVHGYDELGRSVCPVFEIEDCADVQGAIHREIVRDARDRSRILYTGRLTQVNETDVEKYPQWTGHPDINDKPETIHQKILAIRKNQVLGDSILGLSEPSEPYWPWPAFIEETDKDSKQLKEKYIKWAMSNRDKAEEVGLNLPAVTAKAA